jgi:hypothetical protein
MKWCVTFPEEDILIKRPCLKKACGGNKAAATFLSYLLYQVSISQEYKRNAENIHTRKAAHGEDADYVISGNVYRTQRDIIKEMDHELSDRTLRDNAIPWLIALGYIEVDTSRPVNIYVVHIHHIQHGISNPPDKDALLLAKERFAIHNGKTSAIPLNGSFSDASTDGRISVSDGNSSVCSENTSNSDRKTSAIPLNGSFSDASTDGRISVSNGKFSDSSGRISVSIGKTSGRNGNSSDEKNSVQPSPHQPSRPIFQTPKSNKSIKDNIKRVVVEESVYNSKNEQASATVILFSEKANELIKEVSQSETSCEDRIDASSPCSIDVPTDGDDKQTTINTTTTSAATDIDTVPKRPASHTPLSDEVVVQLWEYVRGARYEDKDERSSQIRAARTLQSLPLITQLTVDLLEKVYNTYYDDFWRRRYGTLHLTHLVAIENSTGQRRIVRWLNRLCFPQPDPASAQPPVDRSYATDASGRRYPERTIFWKGRVIPEEQAYKEGYYGGFERFLPGKAPEDDLEALVIKYRKEGKIPTLPIRKAECAGD